MVLQSSQSVQSIMGKFELGPANESQQDLRFAHSTTALRQKPSLKSNAIVRGFCIERWQIGTPTYARARHRGQQAPFLPNRFRKAEFTRPRYQSSGVSPAAPPHPIGTNRG